MAAASKLLPLLLRARVLEAHVPPIRLVRQLVLCHVVIRAVPHRLVPPALQHACSDARAPPSSPPLCPLALDQVHVAPPPRLAVQAAHLRDPRLAPHILPAAEVDLLRLAGKPLAPHVAMCRVVRPAVPLRQRAHIRATAAPLLTEVHHVRVLRVAVGAGVREAVRGDGHAAVLAHGPLLRHQLVLKLTPLAFERARGPHHLGGHAAVPCHLALGLARVLRPAEVRSCRASRRVKVVLHVARARAARHLASLGAHLLVARVPAVLQLVRHHAAVTAPGQRARRRAHVLLGAAPMLPLVPLLKAAVPAAVSRHVSKPTGLATQVRLHPAHMVPCVPCLVPAQQPLPRILLQAEAARRVAPVVPPTHVLAPVPLLEHAVQEAAPALAAAQAQRLARLQQHV